jgi:hypothetical protein
MTGCQRNQRENMPIEYIAPIFQIVEAGVWEEP